MWTLKKSLVHTRFVKSDDSIHIFFFFFFSFAISDSRSNLNALMCCLGKYKESLLKGIQISDTFYCFALSIRISFCFSSLGTLSESLTHSLLILWKLSLKVTLHDNSKPVQKKSKKTNAFVFMMGYRSVFLYWGHVKSVSVFSWCHLWGAHQPHYLRTSACGT